MSLVAEVLLSNPAPIAIWVLLILLTFPALLMLSSPAGLRHPKLAAREMIQQLREPAAQRRRQADATTHFLRYAGEVDEAASRATTAAQRWHDRWQETEREMTAAWQAWLDADTRLHKLRPATAWAPSWPATTCAEFAERERHLHRTVKAAADSGALPPEAVADALAGSNGWDARLHPVEQDIVIARASVTWLRQRYDMAAAAERAAWHDTDLARRAAVSLQAEARTATAQARELRSSVPAETTRVAAFRTSRLGLQA